MTCKMKGESTSCLAYVESVNYTLSLYEITEHSKRRRLQIGCNEWDIILTMEDEFQLITQAKTLKAVCINSSGLWFGKFYDTNVYLHSGIITLDTPISVKVLKIEKDSDNYLNLSLNNIDDLYNAYYLLIKEHLSLLLA